MDSNQREQALKLARERLNQSLQGISVDDELWLTQQLKIDLETNEWRLMVARSGERVKAVKNAK